MNRLFLTVFVVTALVSSCWAQEPVAILDARISGHIHPSVCLTKEGTLVVVFKSGQQLSVSRSTDGGATWSEPSPIETSSKRPDVIREVKKFEVYPGTADTLPDGRVLVTWNYIADDKETDGYYERALLYSLSEDDGVTWSDQALIAPVEGKHFAAVRHNVLPWSGGRWLLPLRVGPPRIFDPKTGETVVFPLVGPDGKQHEFQQISRTADGSLLAMGPVLLRSTNEGKTWTEIESFPVNAEERDNLEGRFLTTLSNGGVIVTWGVGSGNKGLSFNFSPDNGQTWKPETRILLPETAIAARYYSARTIQLDNEHVGIVFMNSKGIYFLKTETKSF